MTITTREFSEKELNQYFIWDEERCFLKHDGTEESFSVEPGIDGAQIFPIEAATETIEINPGRNFELIRVGDILDVNEFELEEHE